MKKKEKYCSICAGKLRPSKKRPGMMKCVDCDAWYVAEKPAEVQKRKGEAEGNYCPNCGSMLFFSDKKPGSRFCKKCEEYWKIPGEATA